MGNYTSFGCKVTIKNVPEPELKIFQLIHDFYFDYESYGENFNIENEVSKMLDNLTDISKIFFSDDKWYYIFGSYDHGNFENEFERKIEIDGNNIHLSIQSELKNHKDTITKFLNLIKQFSAEGNGKKQFECDDDFTIIIISPGSVIEILPSIKNNEFYY